MTSKKPLPGESLAERNPELAKQWHPTKNGDVAPWDVKPGSSTIKPFWIGKDCSHEWDALIHNTVRSGGSCPFCANKRVLPGFNDFATVLPELASQWHPTKNGDMTPQMFTRGSDVKAWWLDARCGHEYEKKLTYFVAEGAECPYCSNSRVLAGFNDLANTHPTLASQWDTEKNVGVSPTEIMAGFSKEKVFWKCPEGHEWDDFVNRMAKREEGYCPVCRGVKIVPGVNDIFTLFPHLAEEWNYERNGELDPVTLSYSSNLRAHWKCSICAHEWNSLICNRTRDENNSRRSTGCPACAKEIKVRGNRIPLSVSHPEIATEWHPTKNSLRLEQVSKGSSMKVWWMRSECGHEWQMAVKDRTVQGQGCSICGRRQVLRGFNDLASQLPEVAALWHSTKNGDLTPAEVSPKSGQYVWWQCEKNHEWESLISNVSNGSRCPTCNSASATSQAEKEIVDIIGVLLPEREIRTRERRAVRGVELDIYAPELKVAIEFNGLYWHTENMGKDRYYHATKTQKCADVGIQLIHVWEDDWIERRDIVIRAIAHRMKASERLSEPGVLTFPDAELIKRFGARALSLETLKYQESAEFLNQHHIQGSAKGTLHVGLRSDDDKLRAVMVLRRTGNRGHEGEWTIERYATYGNVPGGFTRLLKFAEKHAEGITSWVTFSDIALSDGGLYKNHGFILDKTLKPDYAYAVNKQRKHKFGYRLKRFRDDTSLTYDKGLTERQLAELNGLYRIWDCGKLRWVKPVAVKTT